MFNKNNELVVIDFDRCDYGDQQEEFNRLAWSIQVSHEFATEIVDDYFNKKVPEEFWKLLALYMSLNSRSSLLNDILDWYNDIKRYIPKWYK